MSASLPEAHRQLVALFEQLRESLQQRDAKAFVALCARDIAPPLDVFEANSAGLLKGQRALRLKAIEQEEQLATVRFDVLGQQGAVVDEGHFVATEEADGWRLRAL